MLLRTIVSISLLLVAKTLLAALPPAAESLRRLKVITESKEVYEQLESSDWVKAITQTSEDAYILSTQKCQIFVSVLPINKPPSHPRLIGPLPLMVTIQKKECQ
ncbi:MAG: hypothetical protein AB7I18_03685 [Candidatus Berkiella sp.]